MWIAVNSFTWTRSQVCLREWSFTPFTTFKSRERRESSHGSLSRPCVLVNRFTAPLLGHSDVIRRVIMICFTGTDGEPIHVNEKCHAVDKMNDESDESVHLSPCVYVKDEPGHGNTLWTMNDESVHGNTRVKDKRWLGSSFTVACVYALMKVNSRFLSFYEWNVYFWPDHVMKLITGLGIWLKWTCYNTDLKMRV